MCLPRQSLWITIARRAAAILAQGSLIGHKNKPSLAKSDQWPGIDFPSDYRMPVRKAA